MKTDLNRTELVDEMEAIASHLEMACRSMRRIRGAIHIDADQLGRIEYLSRRIAAAARVIREDD